MYEEFFVESIGEVWKDYGITEKVGYFGNLPRRYKIIEVRTERQNENVVKPPDFIPLPNQVAKKLVKRLASEFSMKVKEEEGKRYVAVLQAANVQKEVQVGDPVSWGLIVSNETVGNFTVNAHLLRLACTNGLVMPEDSRTAKVQKSYDVEQLYDSLERTARAFQNRFEEEVEFLKRLKQYRMNQRFAEVLAQRFPRPIIEGLVEVKIVERAKVVQDFARTDLYRAYNQITYNISHRPLKLGTHMEWGSEATRLFMQEVKEQEKDEDS